MKFTRLSSFVEIIKDAEARSKPWKNTVNFLPVYFCCRSHSPSRRRRYHCFPHFFHFSHPPTPFSNGYFIHCHARNVIISCKSLDMDYFHTNSIRGSKHHSHRQADMNAAQRSTHRARMKKKAPRLPVDAAQLWAEKRKTFTKINQSKFRLFYNSKYFNSLNLSITIFSKIMYKMSRVKKCCSQQHTSFP